MKRRVIINFPTNLGDTILSLPVVDRIRARFPDYPITAISSPKTKELLLANTFIEEVVEYKKHWTVRQKIRFCFSLRGKYEVMVDLKNSALPFFLGAAVRTPYIRNFSPQEHITDKYLSLIFPFADAPARERSSFILSDAQREVWKTREMSPSVFIALSSRSPLKRYPQGYLKDLIEKLSRKYPVALIGEKRDAEYYGEISSMQGVVDLAGKTTMSEVFYLLEHYALVCVCVDSSIMHAASYMNIPVIALFGPTHPERSKPRSAHSMVLVDTDTSCRPCEKAECARDIDCMKIAPRAVIEAVEKSLCMRKHPHEGQKTVDK